MQRYIKCLWWVKKKYTPKTQTSHKAELSRTPLYPCKTMNSGWKRGSSKWKWWLCCGDVVSPSPAFLISCDVCCLIDFIYSLEGKQSQCLQSRQCGAVLTFCQQMEMPHFLFFCQSCYQQKALVSAWRSSRFSAFLIKYVTMIAPAPEEPWKLFLIKLFGFRGADSGFIRPEVYTIWKSSLRKIVIQNCGYKIKCRALEGVPTNKNH